MCRVGDFNCSQASLTSAEALAALRELPKSNPALYKEFTGECEDVAIAEEELEPAFSEESGEEDDSDIPIDVIVAPIEQDDVGQGFQIDSDGRIERTGVAEDAEAEIPSLDAVLILGRGKRAKISSTRYTSAWEQH
jgi:hypothetical protein